MNMQPSQQWGTTRMAQQQDCQMGINFRRKDNLPKSSVGELHN
jgi:hypothetical protein